MRHRGNTEQQVNLHFSASFQVGTREWFLRTTHHSLAIAWEYLLLDSGEYSHISLFGHIGLVYFLFAASQVSVGIPSRNHLQNCQKVSEILSYLQASKLGHHNFVSTSRRYETLGSNTNNFINHGTMTVWIQVFLGSSFPTNRMEEV